MLDMKLEKKFKIRINRYKTVSTEYIWNKNLWRYGFTERIGELWRQKQQIYWRWKGDPKREFDQWHPSNSEVKNVWSCASTPPYVLKAWCFQAQEQLYLYFPCTNACKLSDFSNGNGSVKAEEKKKDQYIIQWRVHTYSYHSDLINVPIANQCKSKP
jgi:hypothetical protein